jgi:uncharacterized membrane protein
MSPDLLSAKPVRPVPASLQARASHLWIPIAVSALAGGGWTVRAFLHPRSAAAAGLLSLLAALGYAAVFAAVTTSAGRWTTGSARAVELRRQLARCSFASVVLVLFLPEYLARVPPPLLRSSLLLGIASLLWLSLCADCILRERNARWRPRVVHTIALLSLVLLFLLATALAIRKYWVFGYVGQDLAYFGQIMQTTLHGHLFWGNLLQDLIYSRPVTTDFAGHNSPVMFLFLPFYALYPSPITLLVLRNLVLFSCALPVFLLANRRVPPAASCLWAGAFLLTPAILYQSVFDFYPLTFVALPLLFTLYFYLEQRYTAFCIALALTLLVREDLVFFAFGIGLLALLDRRPMRWSLLPLTVAVAWAALSFLIILPTALHGATYVTDACFSHLGRTPADMLHNILVHPRENILVHGNIVYLKTLLTATALLLSCGSLISMLSLPYLAINLLAGAGRCITTVIFAQYSVIPAVLLFTGSLLAVTTRNRDRLFSKLGRLGLHSPGAAPMLLLALSSASLVFVTDTSQANDFREQPWGPEARQVLHLIPSGAAVAAPRYMLPHLANRNCLYQAHRLLEYHTAAFEYLILDRDWSHIDAADIYRTEYERVERIAASDPALRTIYTSPQYRVYWNSALQGRNCVAGAPLTNAAAVHP